MTISPLATAAGTDRCPDLPQGSGLAWTASEGPDFSACYAASPTEPAGGTIGVYLGFHPDIQPKEDQILRPGQIDGSAVTWYRKQGSSPQAKAGAETTLPLGMRVAHIWVLAPGQQAFDQMLQTAERLHFRAAR